MRRNTNNHNARYCIINSINEIESADEGASFYRKSKRCSLKDSQMIPYRPGKTDRISEARYQKELDLNAWVKSFLKCILAAKF